MHKLVMLFGFSMLILGAGLLAGQRVQSSQVSTTTKPADPAIACENLPTACAISTPANSHETLFEPKLLHAPQAESVILPASHQRTLEEELELAGTADNAASPVVQKPDAQTTEQLRKLIQLSFPEASHETVSVWAEVYAGMDLSEVEFILEQKRALSGALDSQFPGIAIAPGPSSRNLSAHDGSSSLHTTADMSPAVATVERNLNNAWSVGFRRTVVLPHASVVSSRTFSDITASTPPTMFTDFTTGRLISSPMPLHVAVRSNTTWMFRLEGDKLTRRGDFQLLSDRRIGLIIGGITCAVANSPLIPEDACRLSINPNGGIEYTDSSNTLIIAGQLEIVNVTEPDQLESTDGVHFTSRSSMSLQTVTAAEIVLATGMLELSNVDREEEAALLNHLRGERDLR